MPNLKDLTVLYKCFLLLGGIFHKSLHSFYKTKNYLWYNLNGYRLRKHSIHATSEIFILGQFMALPKPWVESLNLFTRSREFEDSDICGILFWRLYGILLKYYSLRWWMVSCGLIVIDDTSLVSSIFYNT